jgi:deoxyribodipyrimidine photolyase-related protein
MRVSVWILGDQLLKQHPALDAVDDADDVQIVMVESHRRAKKLPYHRQKLTLLLSAMRHYAERLRDEGLTVDYRVTDKAMVDGLRAHVDEFAPDVIYTMAAADYEGRQLQTHRLSDELGVDVNVLDNTQFLLGQFNPYPEPEPDKNYVMEYFYRAMRKHFNVLMDDGDQPAGGKWNFDKQNRKSLPDDVALPDSPNYSVDDITQDVIDMVNNWDVCVGQTDGFNYAVTHRQAEVALDHFVKVRLEQFGPYEDAMTTRGSQLFHSILSPYFNIGLLDPLHAIERVEQAYRQGDAPINSVEGFIRQVLGWREFMYWQYWQLMPGLRSDNHWQGHRKMPQMFWDGDTEMNCIRHIVKNLQETAYSHHIERLMVVSNFCLLIGVEPQRVTEWFKAFYIDAYDWVMQPNVVGMGLNADGGKIATKPYVASANYINKMGDYCGTCPLKHNRRTGEGACPFNYLYWNFLIENEAALRANPRSGRNVLGLRHLDDAERERVQAQAQAFMEDLAYYDHA